VRSEPRGEPHQERLAPLSGATPNDALEPAGRLRYKGPAFLAELGGTPWSEPGEWTWTASVEAVWRDIRDEFEKNAAAAVAQEYRVPFDAVRHSASAPSAAAGGTWDAIFLRRHGEWVARNSALFPVTCEVLASTPLGSGEALFSILGPGERIAPHSSGCNLVLTCHLPLIVPGRCGINVAGEARHWTEGTLLAFDDSWLHRAWNDADASRVVLIWDVWHQSLTRSEIDVLNDLLLRLLPDS
jgi:aspartyl/asparaginyl beta-hydroxylase (cupin superfamily)